VSRPSWIETRAYLKAAPEDWSTLAEAFVHAGCPSTIQVESPPQIAGYLQALPHAEDAVGRLKQRLFELGADKVETRVVEEEDWGEAWKRHFRPVRVGKVRVRPSWEDPPSSARIVDIVLDPGQAFGTGDHATTRLCLRLLQSRRLAGKSVLDLGCGSGILSIAAKKLGARRVLGADIDQAAVEISTANARSNHTSAEFVQSDGLEHPKLDRRFDLILSNIVSAVLVRIAPDIHQRLEPGGAWIVSGVLSQNWPDVKKAALRAGLIPIRKTSDSGWVAAVLEPKADSHIPET
jgi:ribosomal protein L11 methyltransferase